MATISVSSITENSVTVYLDSLDTSWANGTRSVYWYLRADSIPTANNWTQLKQASLSNGVSSGGTATFSNLSANKKYGIYCTIYHNDTRLAEVSRYVYTLLKWNWNASNGSASKALTEAANDALLYKQATKNFSHLVWNDLVDKVNNLRKVKGLTWRDTYAAYEDTKMYSTPYILTAVKFNSLIYNVNDIRHTGMFPMFSSGEEVKSDYFYDTVQSINEAIDLL